MSECTVTPFRLINCAFDRPTQTAISHRGHRGHGGKTMQFLRVPRDLCESHFCFDDRRMHNRIEKPVSPSVIHVGSKHSECGFAAGRGASLKPWKAAFEHTPPFPTVTRGESPHREFPARGYAGVGRAWRAGEPREG